MPGRLVRRRLRGRVLRGLLRRVLPPYRFTVLAEKARELATEVRSLGASLLAAYEKGDAEHLAALRAAQERQLLELGLATHQMAWRDADWQVQALGKTKESAPDPAPVLPEPDRQRPDRRARPATSR